MHELLQPKPGTIFAVEGAAFTCPGRDAPFYARGDGGEAGDYDIAGRWGWVEHFVFVWLVGGWLLVGVWCVVELLLWCGGFKLCCVALNWWLCEKKGGKGRESCDIVIEGKGRERQ